MALRLIVLVIVVGFYQSVAFGQEAKTAKWSGSPAETQLVELVDALYQRYAALHAEAAKITDEKLQQEFYNRNDPAKDAVPKLLSLEAQHPGTDVGLMALRRIVLLAAGGGVADGPCDLGRREAFARLNNYADRPILPEILRYVDGGNYEPATKEFLRSLAQNRKAIPVVRQYSAIALAGWMLALRDSREHGERRLRELEHGAAERFPEEAEYYVKVLKVLPAADQLQAFEKESIDLLRQSSESKSGIRQPAVQGIDPKWHLIRIDEEATKTMPLLTDLAAGVLFKESHLRLEKPAPDLEVALVSGSKWSMGAQRGKVVIVQFSFKGCGPCEAMYPDLRELQQANGDRLSILSIMADKERKDTDEAVAGGKLTWNVAWDGFRGPIATRWAVQSFPTIYVIGPTGHVAGKGLRGEALKDKVAELLK